VAGVKKGRVAAIGVFDEAAGSESIVVIAETPSVLPEERRDIARAVKNAILMEMGVYVGDVYPVNLGWIIKTTSGKVSREENKKKYLGEKSARAPGKQAAA
jgi:fatty-acyl-CoA synthase